MKKFIYGLLAVVLMQGCSKSVVKQENTETDMTEEMNEKIKVTVTTSFLEDMTNVLAGDFVDIELVIPAGEDPHTYEAKPEDYNKLSDADLILYHGLHFEGKMIELLESQNGIAVTSTFDESNLLIMEEEGVTITDPHFWFDVDLYKEAVKNAAEALKEKLPENALTIEENLSAYLKELDELKDFNTKEIGSIPKESRILITPHDAFSYFARQYDIEVKAPQGVSTDAELSTNEMAETADFIVEHKVKAIFAESTTDPARMEKLKESCKAKGFDVMVVSGEGKELFSDSLAPKGEAGDSYIEMVKHNVDLIVSNLK